MTTKTAKTKSTKTAKTKSAKATGNQKPESEFTVLIPLEQATRVAGAVREYIDFEGKERKVGGRVHIAFALDEHSPTFLQAIKRFLPGSPQAAVADRILNRPVEALFDILCDDVQ